MKNTFNTKQPLKVGNQTYQIYSLQVAEKNDLSNIAQLPYSLKILLENLLRNEDGETVTRENILALANWPLTKISQHEIAYRPIRVLMQDFTGVPAIVDLAAMRDAIQKRQGDPKQINPLSNVDLVIDHSIQVDAYASAQSLSINSQLEMQRNQERYAFLRWGQKAFRNFRVVPPETGICHQVNLEFLAKTIWFETINGEQYAYPDTLVGTDSHTTMINGLGVLGWGVGGIEAEAAMLGQPISMVIPEVIGVRLKGKLAEGITATDCVLTITELLRKKGVVGKFVEYTGPGLQHLSVADRATLANMAPEYGATCGFFPIDQVTLDYLQLTGRDEQLIALVEAYAKAQGLWHTAESTEPVFTDVVEVDLSCIQPSIAGPKRPQDRVLLSELKSTLSNNVNEKSQDELRNNDIVIAAITSCTNTSNPHVLIAAGLLAKKAVEKGLQVKPWVKTSLAPGSRVVTRYLHQSGLQQYLDQLGFNTVGYGCTTCIGNSGPLTENIAEKISKNNLAVAAILSGNRNFEGRIHPLVKSNWLASPPLVVAFALAGTMNIDLTREAISYDKNNVPIYLKDIWPSNAEIAEINAKIHRDFYQSQYADVFAGNAAWQNLPTPQSETYTWQSNSTYIQHPPYFENSAENNQQQINGARILALLGDSITTDHISPAGSIKADSPAGKYLLSQSINVKDFNSYGARRGNHQVMMRGTFANIRIRNEILQDIEGGFTRHWPSQQVLSIYDAAMLYQAAQTPVIIVAGKEYGTGSSRDWAAKGPKLLGVKAVIAESYERIHRSNLVGMGILPLQFPPGVSRKTLNLQGDEILNISVLAEKLQPQNEINVEIYYADGRQIKLPLLSRIDTWNEVAYYQQGGILQYVLQRLL